DGGMSANPTFVQALADAGQRVVEVSPVLEATTLGAAFLAGLAVGTWRDEAELAATWSPRETVEPRRKLDRDRWRDACARSARWLPGWGAAAFAPPPDEPGRMAPPMTLAALLEQVGGPDPPIAIEAYDGSRRGPSDPPATLSIRSQTALRRIVQAPGELGFG